MSTPKSDAAPASIRHIGLKIAVPVAIGLAVVAWLFHSEFSEAQLHTIRFTPHALVALAAALLFMAGRDFGLAWRYRRLSDGDLSWWQALRVTLLCEFMSAITPSAVGGSSFAILFMHSEGVNWGRSAALVLTTLFFDELFVVVMWPAILLFIPEQQLFGFEAGSAAFAEGLQGVFWGLYIAIALYTVLLFAGIVVRPQAVRRVLIALFSLPGLRRWKGGITAFGDNMVEASRQLRAKRWGWWAKVFAATCLSWSSRFLVVNMLFWGFVGAAPQGIVFARQFIVWVVLMISPTPGGSGVSEWIFKNFYGDLIPTAALVMVIAILWRIISYYVYLFIGAVLVPRWVSRQRRRRRHQAAREGAEDSGC